MDRLKMHTVDIADENIRKIGELFPDCLTETREVLRTRPVKANLKYFEGKSVEVNGAKYTLNDQDAMMIVGYLRGFGYIDNDDKVTQLYKDALKNGTLQPVFPALKPIEAEVHELVQALFDESVALEDMVEDGHATLVPDNRLNENFKKKEFQELWKSINGKYAYTVHYDSAELVRKAVASVDANLFVPELKYIMTVGAQEDADNFGDTRTATRQLGTVSTSTVRYDLVGEIARRTSLTRKTVCAILRGIRPVKLAMFRNNPEEFIGNVSRLIRDEKATMIVDHISYNKLDETYDSDIFTREKHGRPLGKAYFPKKSIQDYIFIDGYAEESTEKKFAKALDEAAEVCVYAKLPRAFQIPTPVGNYSPDWAIAFREGTVKHIYFIAETKGSMDSMQLKAVEKAKIKCAERLFNDVSTSKVRYHKVDSYQTLLDIMKDMD